MNFEEQIDNDLIDVMQYLFRYIENKTDGRYQLLNQEGGILATSNNIEELELFAEKKKVQANIRDTKKTKEVLPEREIPWQYGLE